MKNPCFPNGIDCPKRTAGCHATCPEGLAADAERRERKEKINKVKAGERISTDFAIGGIQKRKKRERNMKSYGVKL